MPIINPLIENPKDALYVKTFRYYSRNPKGRTTIDVLALNDTDHFEIPRAKIAFQIADDIETQFDSLREAHQTRNLIKVRKSISKIKSLLSACGPTHEYSAVISTYILYEFDTYKDLEVYLKTNCYWDLELEDIKKSLLNITLEK